MEREQLADFVRRRREELGPEDVGLPAGARRRTPGLRRDEVARLVGMSTDYVTRIEQARSTQPSLQMVAAMARALRLTEDERDHLHRLCGYAAPERRYAIPHVAPALQRVFDQLQATPALVISDLGETLLSNALADALFGDVTTYEGFERSDAYRWFTIPATRQLYPAEAHEAHSRTLVANLRAAHGQAGDDSRAGRLVDALLQTSPEFAELWARHEVARRFEERKTLVHPEIGPIELDCQALFTENQSQTLLVLTPTPGSAAAAQIELLAVVGSARFSDG